MRRGSKPPAGNLKPQASNLKLDASCQTVAVAELPPITLTKSQTERWTTIRDDLVTSLLATWLIAGLFVDGWAHRNLDGIETFFTPWHALFYSGFVAVAGWMVYLVRRHSGVPVGYGPGIIGVGVFALGAVGDLIWHTIFGIETSLDALLSPTHLVLLTGILLILTSPIRSAWHRPTARASSWGQILPALAGTTLVIGVLQFFFLYASGWTSGLPGVPYSPDGDELLASYGVLEIMISTAIMFGGVLALLKRYRPPPGSFVLVFGVVGILMSALDGFVWPWEVLQMVVAGAATDVLARSLDPDPEVPNRFRAVRAAGSAGGLGDPLHRVRGVSPKSGLAARDLGRGDRVRRTAGLGSGDSDDLASIARPGISAPWSATRSRRVRAWPRLSLTEMANGAGADGFVPITAAHIDGCLFHGQAGLDFAERLLAEGARVRVPTTLNVSSLDLLHPHLYRGDPETARSARRLMEVYEAMGCQPTWTCAPYQLPAQARIRSADRLGRVECHRLRQFGAGGEDQPLWGLPRHLLRRDRSRSVLRTSHRRGPAWHDRGPTRRTSRPDWLDSDWLYPVLGSLIGRKISDGDPGDRRPRRARFRRPAQGPWSRAPPRPGRWPCSTRWGLPRKPPPWRGDRGSGLARVDRGRS